LFGRDASFVVNAVSFAVAAGLVVRIRAPFRTGPGGATAAGAGVLAHLGEVWAFVRPRKLTAALMLTKTGVGLANGIVGLLPAFALGRYGAGSAGIGLLLGARGFGALIGPFVGRAIARAGGRPPAGGGAGDVDGRRLLVVCGGSIVAYAVAYAFLPLIDSLAGAVGCVALAHAGGGAQWVLSTYGLQVTTPDAVRGRVLSLDFGLATLAIGVSSVAAGSTAGLVGLQATSWGMVALALGFGSAWLWWTRELWRGPTDPLAAAADALSDPGPASGPRAPKLDA
jgi:hypothetical protein